MTQEQLKRGNQIMEELNELEQVGHIVNPANEFLINKVTMNVRQKDRGPNIDIDCIGVGNNHVPTKKWFNDTFAEVSKLALNTLYQKMQNHIEQLKQEFESL